MSREEEDELEPYIRDAVYAEIKADGQSDKFFENIWGVWWGLMDTDIKNGLIKGIHKFVDDCTKDCGG